MTDLQNARQWLAADFQRPQYHFLPPANWMNDPNGLMQWRGQYHLFYQYNPNGPYHGTIHWGHAASDDLLHWRDLPIALAPTPGGPDAGGCWSGCAVDDGGVPTLVYTGIEPQAVCLATATDPRDKDLISWKLHPGSPVIAGPPETLGGRTLGQFRDPFVWKDGDIWRMVIGSKLAGEGGAILHYRSPDLLHWEYLGILLKGDLRETESLRTGTVWECPNLFKLGERTLLFFSAQEEPNDLIYTLYTLGNYDGEQFTPVAQDKLVHGSAFYAPQAMRSEDGRVVMFGWLKEERSPSACLEAGWAGVMSVPISVSITESGRLSLEPVEELKSLRGEHWHGQNIKATTGSPGWLSDIQGGSLEIEAVFTPDPTNPPGSAFSVGVSVLRSADGAEETRLIYDGEGRRLMLDTRHASLSAQAPGKLHEAPLSLEETGELRLHIFIDRSVIEVFAHGICMACRVYPSRPESAGLKLLVEQGRVRLKSLDVWNIKSVWG